jgi:predicted nucleic acid-binding protein
MTRIDDHFYVLDASAILRFTDKEAGFDRVRDLFIQAAQGNAELLLSAVNWGEIVGALLRRAGGLSPSALTNIGSLVANLAALPVTVVAADKDLAEAAAIFKYDFKVPFVDAFAGSLALHENATLVTADYDFKNVPPGAIKIEFLPAK